MNYTVSIRLMTFNHEGFIRNAMDGILMQKTNFLIEVVIGDDFSEDKTLKIIKSYSSTQNIHIKILERKKGDGYWKIRTEKGRLYNFLNILENCSAKYIALLDGDDYWTDENKLQKQVDFLEANEDFSICFHPVYVLNGNTKAISDTNTQKKDFFTIEQLSKGNFLQTPSVVFRNIILEKLPIWFNESPVGDYIVYMLLAKEGKIKCLPDVMATYREHDTGTWSKAKESSKLRRWEKVLSFLLKENFEDTTLKNLKEQRNQTINKLLEYTAIENWKQFVADLDFYTKSDEELTRYWLTKRLPEMVELTKNSRSFVIGQKIKQVFTFFKK